MSTVILSCESLEVYVAAAQKMAGTTYPVIWLKQKYHEEPAVMRSHILETIASLPKEVDTVLVAMGFCGGSWDSVIADRRIVLPRVDDCISLLLHTDDTYHPNLKQMGHMYMLDGDPDKFSPELMFQQACEKYSKEEARYLFDMWFANYSYLDIVDTGMADCYSEAFVEMAQRSADLIKCDLDYTVGSNLLLEKLVSGQWDKQFLVAQAGHAIAHVDYLSGKDATQGYLAQMILLASKKHTVILTGNRVQKKLPVLCELCGLEILTPAQKGEI